MRCSCCDMNKPDVTLRENPLLGDLYSVNDSQYMCDDCYTNCIMVDEL